MKLLTRTLSLVTIAALALFFINCGGGGDGASNKEKKQLNKLKASVWNLSSATLDGDTRTADFSGFKLTIGGDYDSDSPEGPYTYSVQGNTPDPSPWPAAGSWEFSTISSNQVLIVRDPGTADEIGMTYHFEGNNLVMEMTLPDGAEGWRTAQVSGDWVFTFTPGS